MTNFSSVYKKNFKQILLPHGYDVRKNFFYKMDNDICFFIMVKKGAGSRLPSIEIEAYIDFAPYCADLQSNVYEIKDDEHKMTDFFDIIMPDENVADRFSRLFFADNEDVAINNLRLICDNIEHIILPYIHRFTDLEFFYNEIKKILEEKGITDIYVYRHAFVHGLAVKLHKCNDALIHVDSKMSIISGNIKYITVELDNIKKGTVNKTMLLAQKTNPNVIRDWQEEGKKTLVKYENELSQMQITKEALLTRDYNFLDNYISGVEINSREYIKQIIVG